MTLKDIKQHYDVSLYPDDANKDKFLLFKKEGNSGRFWARQYLCTITRHKSWFSVEGGRFTDNFEMLVAYINNHLETLKYHSDCYMPMMRDGMREYFCIITHLEKLGFKSNMSDGYTLSKENIYNYTGSKIMISFSGLNPDERRYFDEDASLKREVTVYLHVDEFRWIESKTDKDPDNIVRVIEALIKPLLLSESINYFDMAEPFRTLGVDNVALAKAMGMNSVRKQDYKKELKRRLMEMADAIED